MSQTDNIYAHNCFMDMLNRSVMQMYKNNPVGEVK